MKFLVEVELSDKYKNESAKAALQTIEDAIGEDTVPWLFKTLKVTEVKDV